MAYLNIDDSNATTSGNIATSTDVPTITSANLSLVPYTPIGIGKPLSIQIMTIYTGAFPQKKGLFKDNKRDLVCVSGVKAFETFDATPRAINVFEHHIAEKSFVDFSAFAAATPYIYYKKAVDDEFEFTVELSISVFDDDLFTSISSLFNQTSKLPLFMPAAGKLLTAGQVVDLAKVGADDLFQPDTVINETISVQFNTAGMPVSSAQSLLIYPSGIQYKQEFAGYQIETKMDNGCPQMRLANNEEEYTGDAPYIIVNIDGAEKPELESWAAMVASSSIVSKFYGDNSAPENLVQDLGTALQLYNDYRYCQKAGNLASEIKNMKTSDPNYSAHQTLYQSYVDNISKDSAYASQVPAFPLNPA